jgi:multiple sugar transport system substrate-binding protein
MNKKLKASVAIATAFATSLVMMAGPLSGAAAAAAHPKVTLVFTMWGSSLDTKTYTERAHNFMKLHPGVDIIVKNLPATTYPQDVKQLIVAGGSSTPDIIEMSENGVSDGLQSAVVNLAPYIKRSHFNLNRYLPGFVKGFNQSGDQYAVPDRGGYMVLYYNKKLFERAHIPFPTAKLTLDQFLNDAKRLTIRKHGKTIQWGLAVDVWNGEYMNFVHMFGGHFFTANLKQAMIDNPRTEAGLNFYNNLAYKWHVSPTVADYANMGSNANRDVPFSKGQAAMMVDGMWSMTSMAQAGIQYGISPLPKGPAGGAMMTTGTGLAIDNASTHKALDWEFIQYMETYKGQLPIVLNHEDMPSNKKDIAVWARTLPKGVSYAQLKQASNEIFSMRVPHHAAEIWNAIGTDLTNFFDGRQAIKPAAAATQKNVTQLMLQLGT